MRERRRSQRTFAHSCSLAAAVPSDPNIRSRPGWGLSAGLLVLVLFAFSLSARASAGTISVTTTLDQFDGSAPCSLREAVTTANTDADGGGCTDANPAAADTIRLAGGDYNLRRAGRRGQQRQRGISTLGRP